MRNPDEFCASISAAASANAAQNVGSFLTGIYGGRYQLGELGAAELACSLLTCT